MLFGSITASESPKTLSLEQAIAFTLKNNPQIKLAANRIKLRKVEVKRNKLAFSPSLILSATTGRNYTQAPDSLTGEYQNLNTKYTGLTLSVQRDLFNGFYDKAGNPFAVESARGVPRLHSLLNQIIHERDLTNRWVHSSISQSCLDCGFGPVSHVGWEGRNIRPSSQLSPS